MHTKLTYNIPIIPLQLDSKIWTNTKIKQNEENIKNDL